MIIVLSDILTVLGLAILTIGVYGFVRMPDVYTQLHAASKAGFLGIVALLASTALHGDGAIITRAVLITVLLALTTPVAAHAIGRAAHRREEPMHISEAVDETVDDR
ncbi:MAG: monovalent cation/H(+) antiporter subunit G [Solirubrobacteraceae bacterium]|nr:monovalent cation/H(+) antiporter subunit G [Solirubrobacteraceae bacterium]